MNNKLTLALLAATLLVAGGCKTRISVPEGGRVITESGSVTCQAGEVCEVEVTDTTYDETFIAQAADGFEFSSWRRRNRGFCGGNTGPCRLFTSGFVGNPALLAFLSGDEVFFLEPVFTATGGGDFGSGALSACFNPAVLQQGARVVTRSRTRGPDGNFTTDTDQVVDGTGTFAGNAATRVVLEVELSGEEGGSGTATNFLNINFNNRRVRQFGSEVRTDGPPEITITTTFSPFELMRFDLAPGQSYNQSYNIRTENSFRPDLETFRELSTSYLGRETITVPAGRFDTCRIEQQVTDTNSFGQPLRSTDTFWFGVGNGLVIREIVEGQTTELVSARINGSSI